MPPRKTAVIEEFDDDTDLPLPNAPLRNTGARGPLLEEITSPGATASLESDDEDDVYAYTGGAGAGPASPSRLPSQGKQQMDTVQDVTPYKNWTCIYPIYIDAKRRYGTGERRVPRAKSVWWPLSKDIADASNRLGLGTLHEMGKSHPRDWENPGRVRVLWKKDGRLVNPNIRTKKQLLELISLHIHILKPENVPKPPYAYSVPPTASAPHPPTSFVKGKSPAIPHTPSNSNPPPHPTYGHRPGRKPAVPPTPYPPASAKWSQYSPALEAGVLVETVKAGMNAIAEQAQNAPPAPGGGKGKKKVIRVRG